MFSFSSPPDFCSLFPKGGDKTVGSGNDNEGKQGECREGTDDPKNLESSKKRRKFFGPWESTATPPSPCLVPGLEPPTWSKISKKSLSLVKRNIPAPEARAKGFLSQTAFRAREVLVAQSRRISHGWDSAALFIIKLGLFFFSLHPVFPTLPFRAFEERPDGCEGCHSSPGSGAIPGSGIAASLEKFIKQGQEMITTTESLLLVEMPLIS